MKINEVSLGDYPKKATMARAQAQMGAAFAANPAEREKQSAIAKKREAGLARAKPRLEKIRQASELKSRQEYEQRMRDKYAGVDIDAEIARLQPAIDRAYHDYQYGARNTWSQGRDEYNSLVGKVQELKRAKELLSKGVAEGAGNIGSAIKSLYQKIYRAGDDEFEYFYYDSPIFAQYWDEYEGDLDSIIAEVNPKELQVIRDELESYIQQADLSEDWQKVNKRDKTDGMSRKAVKAYRRENPGSKLKTAVTTKPSKLKKGSKSAKRRKSFCARMSGMKKAHASAKTKRDPDSPINKALRRWNCESIEDMRNLIEYAEQVIREEKVRLDPKCWKGKKIGNPKTKMKGGVRVNNCVPAESINEMDKSSPQPGRDGKVSHSTYGSRDKGIASKGPDQYGKTLKAKDVVKTGAAALNKAFNSVKEASSPAQQAAIAISMKKKRAKA